MKLIDSIFFLLFNLLRNSKDTYLKNKIIMFKSYLEQDNIAAPPHIHTTLSCLN